MAYFAAFSVEFGPKTDPKPYFSLVFTKTSMKQTNNAIKFLMAQYRAIFKNAYFKGLTSAVLLTAGLAAGSAQAADVGTAEWDQYEQQGQDLVIGTGGNLMISGSGGQNLNYTTGITFDANASATPSFDNNRIYGTDATDGKAFTVVSTGTLTLKDGRGLVIGYGAGSTAGHVNVTFAETQINDGAVFYVAGGAGASGDATYNTTNFNVTGSEAQVTVSGTASGTALLNATTFTADAGATVTLTASADGKDATLTGENITFTGATLEMKGNTGKAILAGTNATIGADAVMLTTSGEANTISTKNFTVESGAFKVIGDGANAVSETFEGHQGTINGNVLIQHSGAWTLNSVHDEGNDFESGEDKNHYNYDKNSDDIVGDVTFTSGSNVQIVGSGKITVKRGTLTIEDGAGLHAIASGSDNGSITVGANGRGSGDQRPTLVISNSSLKSFLASGDAYHAITKDSSSNYITSEAESKDAAGGLMIESGGLVNFTDATELSDYRFVSGTKTTAGAIAVGAVGSKDTNTIKADTLSISKALMGTDNRELTNDLKLQVIGGDVTLGDGTTAGLNKLSSAHLNEFRVTKSLTLNGHNGNFNVDDGLFMDGRNLGEGNVGQINGNMTINDKGRFDFWGGDWQANGNIKVGNAEGGTGWAAIVGGANCTEDTSLTLTGTLTNDKTGQSWGGILVTASGDGSSHLDIRQATLKSVNDSRAVFEFRVSQNGSMNMTGSQLEGILSGKTSKAGNVTDYNQYILTAESGGTIYVNSSITGEHDFGKFTVSKGTNTTGADTNKVFFGSGGGTLDINGDLSLYTGKDAAGNDLHSGDVLDIGEGTIKADTVYLTNYATKSDKDSTPLDTTFKSGTLEVSEGLVVRNSDRLVLGNGTDTANVVLNSESYTLGGGLSVNNLDITSGSTLKVKTGVWSTEGDIYASGANAFVVGYTPSTEAEIDFLDIANEQDLLVAQFTGDNFNATSAGNVITVHDASKATFNTMQLADGSVVNLDGGHLLVNGLTVTKAQDAAKTDTNPAYVNLNNKTYGTSLTAGIDFGTATVKVQGAGAVMEFGNVATNALVDLDGDANDANKDGSKIAITEGGIDQAQFHVDNFGQLKFNFDEGTALSTADIDALLAGFKMTDTTSNGYLNLGNADLGLDFETRDDGNTQISWDNLADYVNVIGSKATTDKLMSSLVYGIPAADQVKGHYGALSVDVSTTGTTHVGVNGPLTLHNAAAFGNYFVVNSNTGKELGVKLGNGTSLGLVNGGVIGSIIGNGNYNNTDSNNDVVIYNDNGVNAVTSVVGTNNEGIVKVDTLEVQSATEVKGNVEVETLELESTLTSLGEKDTVHVNGGYITDNAALTTYGFEVGNANNTNTAGDVVVLGSLTAQNITLNEASAELAVLDGSVSTTDFTMENGGNLVVGYEPDSFTTEDDPLTQEDETQSYSGEFEATGVTTLNGGNIFVDPIYGHNTSLVSLDDLKGAAADSDQTLVAGTLDGNAFVGQNAALGIGSADLATLKAKIARFQNNGSLDGENVGSVLYLGKAFTLGADQGITLTAQSHEDFIKYYNTNNAAGAADFAEFSETTDGDYPVLDNTLFLGANTAILVDAGVASNADTSRTNPTAMITFAGTTNSTGSVIADGGDIVIDGDVRASTYKVFKNATITYLDGSEYKVVEDDTAEHYDDNINVATENDFLQGVVDTNGQVTLGVNPNGRAIMHGASDPVYATLVAYARGYNGEPTKDEAGNEVIADSQKLYNGYVDTTNEAGETVKTPDYGNYSNYFLQETISTGNGSAAEAVARLAVFGGAAQAAISAGASTYDAVSGRMGVGANGANITVADNTQGAALWLAPIYKSSDSDGFDAEGVDYGVDMDLYGVALGADYTLSNGIRFGAMFNVGSGDVDGQGAGSAVSNDFDYYGFAVYGGYSMGALSVVADVSYTVADNDLEGNTSIDKVGASLDSTNLSLGVTGQYQLDFNGTTVTPHAGLRFSRIDLDDYTIDGADVIADYDADSMNIFSIPVGVTFAKEFTGDAWTVKPSLDLTLTGNFGDDETDGTVHWAGVENLSTNVSSEVLDNFTYGATLGVAAKTGNFSLGLGVNYTGSSNVDEFGVNANARFVF